MPSLYIRECPFCDTKATSHHIKSHKHKQAIILYEREELLKKLQQENSELRKENTKLKNELQAIELTQKLAKTNIK